MSIESCKVVTLTASQDASTNGLLFPLLLSKITATHADGSASLRIELFDAATATGTSVVDIKGNPQLAATFENCINVDFNPPLAVEKGLSSTLTNSPTVKLYFIRR